MADQVKYTSKLNGDKVLVIGGSSGIGFAVAEALVEYGAHVTIASSKLDRVNAALERLRKAYPSAAKDERITGYAMDMGNPDTAEENIKELFEKVGMLDHIVSTAGDGAGKLALDQIDMPKILKAGQVRFFSLLLIAKLAGTYLNPGPKSSITFTTGAASMKPIPGWSVISSFAAGLHGMARGLAFDMKPLRVNLVSSGPMKTEMWDGMDEEARKAWYESLEKSMPTGRVGNVEDLAETYLAIIKDTNMTGTVVSSDGGVLLV